MAIVDGGAEWWVVASVVATVRAMDELIALREAIDELEVFRLLRRGEEDPSLVDTDVRVV